MKETKFRAWDKKEARMIIEDVDALSPRFSMFITQYNQDWKNFELMQYTGLKDKNGVEIYEGDILKCYVNDYNKERGFANYQVVEWESGFGAMFFSEGFGYRINYVNKVEVIGNIHENSELIDNNK